MAKKITFRMHAYSDAAGKYNPEATRNGNEDNFYVDDNLCDEYPSHCESDVVKELCELGLIMAVADGMGGMNAGEIASEIAIETIQDFCAPGKITPEIAKDHESRKKYLENIIVAADARIKEDARKNPEHEGMGSTIILAWIVGDKMTLSWCGDSRAYRYNPVSGIELISEDHSYVQDLVKQGILTYEQTFEHPQGNIITRSLGDESKKAQAETRFFDIYNNDIILLCSDGLSGVLRDRKTPDGEGGFFPGDNLEDIIRNNSQSLVECREALWKAAEAADWYDNVTAILCEIQSGAGTAPEPEEKEESTGKTNVIDNKPWWTKSVIRLSPKNIALILTLIIALIALAFSGYKGYKIIASHFPEAAADTSARNKVPHDTLVTPHIDTVPKSVKCPTPDASKTTSKPKTSSTKTKEELIEKAGSMLESTTVSQPEKRDTMELNAIDEELTKAINIPVDTTAKSK